MNLFIHSPLFYRFSLVASNCVLFSWQCNILFYEYKRISIILVMDICFLSYAFINGGPMNI